jgi:3-hydroxyisobutyrate dehydrogenase
MCTGRQHPLDKKIVPQVLTRRFDSGMSMELIAKDLGIAVELADATSARADIARQMLVLWEEAVRTYGQIADQTELAKLWEDAAGAKLG